MLRAFLPPDEGNPSQTQSNGVNGRESIAKKIQKRMRRLLFFFFGLHFQYVGTSLKLTAPTEKWKSPLMRGNVGEVPQADLSAWQIAEVTVEVFGIFRNPPQKKNEGNKRCRNRYIDDVVVMVESSLESDIWRSFNFKWGREACPELPCHCWGRIVGVTLMCVWMHVRGTIDNMYFCHQKYLSSVSPGNPSKTTNIFKVRPVQEISSKT